MTEQKYEVRYTAQFKKDYKLAKKRNLNITLLKQIISMLSEGRELPAKNRNHLLTGNWAGHWECHIQPDWLLVYRIDHNVLILELARTGTHSDIFGI